MEKVLILENEADLGHLVVFNLRRKRYDITVAHDGREGLGRILKERPDLVTLDLMLPGMNGYEVLKVAESSQKRPNTNTITLY
jgi:DNA-binding response OmpR family regulator